MFGEGKKDKKFLITLIDLPKFKYHTSKWTIKIEGASGSSPEVILRQCQAIPYFQNYNLVICFIDLDKLKNDYPQKWETKKKQLEKNYSNITIIWQIDNAEDEYRKVLGAQYDNKHKLNKMAKKQVALFINSSLWKRILKPIRDTEKELNKL